MIGFLWKSTRGYRLRPWRSPFLRWRIETYCGWKADRIGFAAFWRFCWTRRRELRRFFRWAGEMQRQAAGGFTADRRPTRGPQA
jgi:hypothetical protein